jgi:hypothetical protein
MEQLTTTVINLLVYLVNGILVVDYFTIERFAHMVVVASALLIAGTFDRLIQRPKECRSACRPQQQSAP